MDALSLYLLPVISCLFFFQFIYKLFIDFASSEFLEDWLWTLLRKD